MMKALDIVKLDIVKYFARLSRCLSGERFVGVVAAHSSSCCSIWSCSTTTAAAAANAVVVSGLTEASAGGGRISAGAGDLVARRLGGRDSAPVHLVDNGGIGVGKGCSTLVRLSDNGEIIEVFRDHGEASSAESGGSVVHKGAVVVGHAEVVGAAHLVEVVSHVAGDWG